MADLTSQLEHTLKAMEQKLDSLMAPELRQSRLQEQKTLNQLSHKLTLDTQQSAELGTSASEMRAATRAQVRDKLDECGC